MGKPKSAEVLSLNKDEQRKVVKETKNLKKKIKDGKITVKEKHKLHKLSIAQSRGLVYIGHIPHGFYEDEMKNYFKQFGVITNVKVCRSRKSGNSKGYGFVEFLHPEVAKIAAETMNNYLMFKKRLVAEYVPFEKRPKRLFQGKASTPTRYSSKVRRDKQIRANSKVDFQRHLARTKSRLSNLKKKMEKIKKAGVTTDFEPTDVPSEVKKEKNSDEETTDRYQYDSDVELKIPLKRSKKSVKSSSSKVSTKKSKSSRKSQSPDTTESNKILLAKSLDSVKALLSSIGSSNSSNLKASQSIKKVNKATSVPKFKREGKKGKINKLKGITKKAKPKPLDADTVKKIARELIRKRGDSLLNLITTPKRRPNKTKTSKK